MTCSVRLFRGIFALLLLAGLCGCFPSGQNQFEEEKEPHFLEGKNCLNGMDYKGAIEEFEKALKVNPDSASAHFQLGWLYEQKDPDPAAAIYHYQEFLKLRPGADNAEWIRQHINNCKQDLAKTVLPLPVTPGMQHEFEQLAEENKRLRTDLDNWRAYAARLQTLTNQSVAPPPPVRSVPLAGPPDRTNSVPLNAGTSDSATLSPRAHGAAGSRTYVVKTNDSYYSISRRTGVKLDALAAANPGVDPKRLRVGQTLNLPVP